jgi:hypothetical protein
MALYENSEIEQPYMFIAPENYPVLFNRLGKEYLCLL